MREKQIEESERIFALTAILMISLILVSVGVVLWLVQMILIEISQLKALLDAFGM